MFNYMYKLNQVHGTTQTKIVCWGPDSKFTQSTGCSFSNNYFQVIHIIDLVTSQSGVKSTSYCFQCLQYNTAQCLPMCGLCNVINYISWQFDMGITQYILGEQIKLSSFHSHFKTNSFTKFGFLFLTQNHYFIFKAALRSRCHIVTGNGIIEHIVKNQWPHAHKSKDNRNMKGI